MYPQNLPRRRSAVCGGPCRVCGECAARETGSYCLSKRVAMQDFQTVTAYKGAPFVGGKRGCLRESACQKPGEKNCASEARHVKRFAHAPGRVAAGRKGEAYNRTVRRGACAAMPAKSFTTGQGALCQEGTAKHTKRTIGKGRFLYEVGRSHFTRCDGEKRRSV